MPQVADPELRALARLAAGAAGVPVAEVVLAADPAAPAGSSGTPGTPGTPAPDDPWVLEVPVVGSGAAVLGALRLSAPAARELTDEQTDRVRDVAQLAAALLERGQRAREQQDLADQAARARERLAAAVAELERSNHELEQFAAVASHDLRAPLAVVDGYVELVTEVYGHQLDQRALDWLATARGGASRMATLIDALLGYAAAGGQELVRAPVDTHAVWDLVTLDLQRAVRAADVRLVVPERLPVVPADAVQLRQLLQNLVANAVKFRRPDRTPVVRCTAQAGPSGWTFTVADNGSGIPAGRREAVFGMFERAADAHAAPGNGIGLATCHRIVTRHGGRIWAEESPGGGATIRFTLPDAAAAPAPSSAAVPAAEAAVVLDALPAPRAPQPSGATQGPGAP